MTCGVDIPLAEPTWDDTGITWDGYERDWDGFQYWALCRNAVWNDACVTWNSILFNWQGCEDTLVNVLQMKVGDTGIWKMVPPTFEGSLITSHWCEMFPPPSVSCWGIQWGNGQIVYYRWVQMNPCIGCGGGNGQPTNTLEALTI